MAKQKQVYKICTKNEYTYQELEGTPYNLENYDVDFCIINEYGYFYIYDTWTGLKACYEGEKTKNKLISKFEKLVHENKNVQELLHNVKKCKSLQQRIDEHNKILDLKKEFEQGTGIKLYLSFGDTIDVVQLDKDVQTPDNVSTRDYISKKYGNKYANIVQKIINKEC